MKSQIQVYLLKMSAPQQEFVEVWYSVLINF